jgi:hypothetical protein
MKPLWNKATRQWNTGNPHLIQEVPFHYLKVDLLCIYKYILKICRARSSSGLHVRLVSLSPQLTNKSAGKPTQWSPNNGKAVSRYIRQVASLCYPTVIKQTDGTGFSGWKKFPVPRSLLLEWPTDGEAVLRISIPTRYENTFLILALMRAVRPLSA